MGQLLQRNEVLGFVFDGPIALIIPKGLMLIITTAHQVFVPKVRYHSQHSYSIVITGFYCFPIVSDGLRRASIDYKRASLC